MPDVPGTGGIGADVSWHRHGGGTMSGKLTTRTVDRTTFDELYKKHERFLEDPRKGTRLLLANTVIEDYRVEIVDNS